MYTIGEFTEESENDINVFINDGCYNGDEEGGDRGVDNDNNNLSVIFYPTPNI